MRIYQFMTTGEIARALGVAPCTVSKWVDSGMMEGFRLPGSLDRRVYRDKFEAFCRTYGMRPEGERPVVLIVTADAFFSESLAKLAAARGFVAECVGDEPFEVGAGCARRAPETVWVDVAAGIERMERLEAFVARSCPATRVVRLDKQAEYALHAAKSLERSVGHG